MVRAKVLTMSRDKYLQNGKYHNAEAEGIVKFAVTGNMSALSEASGLEIEENAAELIAVAAYNNFPEIISFVANKHPESITVYAIRAAFSRDTKAAYSMLFEFMDTELAKVAFKVAIEIDSIMHANLVAETFNLPCTWGTHGKDSPLTVAMRARNVEMMEYLVARCTRDELGDIRPLMTGLDPETEEALSAIMGRL